MKTLQDIKDTAEQHLLDLKIDEGNAKSKFEFSGGRHWSDWLEYEGSNKSTEIENSIFLALEAVCGYSSDNYNKDFNYLLKASDIERVEYVIETIIPRLELQDGIMDKLTKEMFDNIEHGEEIKLNDEYTLYKYTEDDIIVIVKTDEWEEVLQVMSDGDNLVFEDLIG